MALRFHQNDVDLKNENFRKAKRLNSDGSKPCDDFLVMKQAGGTPSLLSNMKGFHSRGEAGRPSTTASAINR